MIALKKIGKLMVCVALVSQLSARGGFGGGGFHGGSGRMGGLSGARPAMHPMDRTGRPAYRPSVHPNYYHTGYYRGPHAYYGYGPGWGWEAPLIAGATAGALASRPSYEPYPVEVPYTPAMDQATYKALRTEQATIQQQLPLLYQQKDALISQRNTAQSAEQVRSINDQIRSISSNIDTLNSRLAQIEARLSVS